MTYLLDVSALMALLWQTHEHHERVTRWQSGKALAVCPLSELGFLRISSQPVLGASVQEARKMLKDWKVARKPQFLPCDLEALNTDAPPTTARTTDFYLASLASRHGLQLATLDETIGHKAVFLIP
jgi:predicted nucleic acid-binding protein